MSPSSMPNLSLMIFAKGARQLVVQEALLTTNRQMSEWTGHDLWKPNVNKHVTHTHTQLNTILVHKGVGISNYASE